MLFSITQLRITLIRLPLVIIVKLNKKDSSYLLKKSYDQSKDQTYFFKYIKKEVLNKCLFPIGDIEKSQVREIAKVKV